MRRSAGLPDDELVIDLSRAAFVGGLGRLVRRKRTVSDTIQRGDPVRYVDRDLVVAQPRAPEYLVLDVILDGNVAGIRPGRVKPPRWSEWSQKV